MTTEGIDISSNNGTVDMVKVKAAGKILVCVKATEGTNFEDPKCKENCAKVRAEGLDLAVYHYLRVRHNIPQDAKLQAQQYYAVWKREQATIFPIVDIELMFNKDATPAEWQTAVTDFIEQINALLYADDLSDVNLIIYTDLGEWTSVSTLPKLVLAATCPLWIAAYTNSTHPTVPAPWTSFVAHQYAGDIGVIGKCDGVQGDCDLDRVVVDINTLRVAGAGSPTDAEPPAAA